MLLSVEKLKASDQRYKAKEVQKQYKKTIAKRRELQESVDESIPEGVTLGNIIGDKENLVQRKKLLSVSAKEPLDFAYERAIGKNDSVYSNFIELLASAKQKVGRVVVKRGVRVIGHATGFMVTERLFMTNWHVFKNKAAVDKSTVEFNYELDISGNPTRPIIFKFDADSFFTSFENLDYCLVAVSPMDITQTQRLESIGYIYLDPAVGKLGDENVERLNIIHHPDGDYKQLSIRQNEFVKILPESLWYKSDTAPGSSGGPVFNDQWQVIALHHMGIADTNARGQYLDKDGKVVPVVNGEIDESKIYWKANEGIRISVIKKHLFATYPDHPLVRMLEMPYTPDPNLIRTPENTITTGHYSYAKYKDDINISVPSAVLTSQKNIHIDLASSLKPHSGTVLISPSGQGSVATETKFEENFDYSECSGYDPLFLGANFEVKFPQPTGDIAHFMAKIDGTDTMQLDYYKFSVIHHGLRRLPLISALNIDGDEAMRKDKTPRRDKWIRDHRIDYTVQLDKDFYVRSGFDRGHMTRREDANYGDSPAEAKRNADLTCVFTNACPQVPKLNRSSYSGLWGKLENIVLEKGAVKENGATGRITVFSGPIFQDDDPIFRSVQVPLQYYKVIVWLSDNNLLNVTAFMLSQKELVGNINFEAIDIDQNIDFKEHQISLTKLQDKTKIDFSLLFEFDTFEGRGSGHVELKSLKKLEKHIIGSGKRAYERTEAKKN